MTINITTNDLPHTQDSDQSFLLNQYVHNKIRVPLETLFHQGDHLITDELENLVFDMKNMNLNTNNLNIQRIWSNKVKPILDQIIFLSESTKQTTIGFIGGHGSGKSSLINSVLDYELLPTDFDDTCTASISAISSWRKPYYQLLVHFITEEQWQFESDNACETLNNFVEDTENELPDDVNAFQTKQKYLFNSPSIEQAPLDSVPENVRKLMIKGYELYKSENLEELKKKLNTFASIDGQLWPIVNKIYIRGPFTKLNNDIILFDIPGFGDGYEAITMRSAEAAVTCDQLVRVVRGDGHSLFTPNFLKGLLKSSTSLKHFSLAITHRNTVAEQKTKENKTNQTLEEQFKEKLRKKVSDIKSKNFSLEYIHKFIDDLPVYYVENKFIINNNWSEVDENVLNIFINQQLNNPISKELDQTRLDIINNINILLKVLSIELSQPLHEIIRDEELKPLTNECLVTFSTELRRLESYLENGCKKLWDEYFWSILKKTKYDISTNQYNTMNYQTLRKNLTGRDYIQISNELSSDVIDESKIEILPTDITVLVNIVQINDLHHIFDEKLFLPLKNLFQRKNDNHSGKIIDQYAKKIQYFIDAFKTSISLQLTNISRLVKHHMDFLMRDEIRENLWIGEQLCNVFGKDTKVKYLTSLRKFIEKIHTTDMNFSVKLYERLSPFFQAISNAFIGFKNDIDKIISNMNFVFVLDKELKEKILQILVPLPLQFTAIDEDTIVEGESNPLLENREIEVTEKPWCLSNIHHFNHEILAPIPKTYIDLSFKYIFYGYVYVLSNEAMPNIYKIGYTTATPDIRAKNLYTTGVPLPFFIEKYYICQNCKLFEQWMHKLFRNHRLNNRREFFQVPLQIIIDVGNQLEIIMNNIFRNK